MVVPISPVTKSGHTCKGAHSLCAKKIPSWEESSWDVTQDDKLFLVFDHNDDEEEDGGGERLSWRRWIPSGTWVWRLQRDAGWGSHINNMCSKANRALGFLRRNQDRRNQDQSALIQDPCAPHTGICQHSVGPTQEERSQSTRSELNWTELSGYSVLVIVEAPWESSGYHSDRLSLVCL